MQTDLYVSVLPTSYQQAKTNCERQGGRLAMPRDADENNALTTLLTKGGVVDRMWLGGHDLGHEGSWVRPDGFGAAEAEREREVPMTWNSWAPGQPDGNDRENCIEMWTSGKWNDAPCAHDKAYACEVPQPPRDLTFPCSAGVVNKMSAQGRLRPGERPTCKYTVFGADGTVVSALKFEFATCNVLCSSISSSSQLAEPRTSDQLQYLARLMRESGDDSMWVGLTPVTPTAYGPGTDGWKWHGSHTALLAAQESWAPGQPGTDGQCVSLWTDGTWNVRGCGGDSRANKVCACEVGAE